MVDKEMWKPIEGYEGYYEVSNMGRVRSVERRARFVSRKGKECTRRVRERIVTATLNKRQGRMSVMLSKSCKKKRMAVHRLVAIAFCDNPHGYTEVNHIDEDPTNNRADNLEWCSRDYNMHYGTIRERVYNKNKKPVIATNDKGDVIRFDSIMAADRLGIPKHKIDYALINGTLCRGYYWRFENE